MDWDITIQTLKEHLNIAQARMKKQADQHRRDVEFAVGDKVFLKIQPYRQRSLAKRRCEKLSPKFFGPYEITERIGEGGLLIGSSF